MLFLTRKIHFSAAHVCRIPAWSDAQNRRMYGDCATGSGHGHDYVCELTVKGAINKRTGIVVNLVDIKSILRREVGALDRTHLNHDHPAFRNCVPTTEMLSLVLWDRLQPALEDCEISRIHLRESRTKHIDYRGEGSMVYVTRHVEFNAAHRLHSRVLSDEENADIFGKCNNPNGHGHNYELDVTVCGPVDRRTGLVMGIDDLDGLIRREIVDRYDHRNLNDDIEEFQALNPTSEEFTRVIWNRLAPHFTTPALYSIRLVETSNNSFEYYGEQETI